MSVAAITAVWRYSAATTTTEIAVLVAMADWADDDGYCYPSHRAIGHKSRASVASVKRVLRLCEQRNELERVAQGGHASPGPREFIGRRGFRPTNLYRITLVDRLDAKVGSLRPGLHDRTDPAVPGATQVARNRVHGELCSDERGYSGQAGVVTRVRSVRAYKEDTLEIPSEDTNAEGVRQERAANRVDGFEEFWSAYPRHVSKKDAATAWRKLQPDTARRAEILAALAWQSRQPKWKTDGGRFVPHPATWLNGRRWEDEAPDRSSGFQALSAPLTDGTYNLLKKYIQGIAEKEPTLGGAALLEAVKERVGRISTGLSTDDETYRKAIHEVLAQQHERGRAEEVAHAKSA